MEFVIAFLLAFAGIIVMIWLGSRSPRHRRRLAAERRSAPAIDPNDLAELSASFASIAAAHRARQDESATAVRLRLQPVISRRCPVRTISPAPVPGATRISFADGTGILVRSQDGRLALLAYEASRYPVCLRSCKPGPDGPELTFDCYGRQFTAVVLGLDQAD